MFYLVEKDAWEIKIAHVVMGLRVYVTSVQLYILLRAFCALN